MRETVSIIVALAFFAIVLYVASSGNMVISDYWTGIAVTLTALGLGVLYWGFRPRINKLIGKKTIQESKTAPIIPKDNESLKAEQKQIEPVPPIEEKKAIKRLLEDGEDITKLNIDNNLLDQIYEQAHNQAINIFHDAQLTNFTIQVFPFFSNKLNRVTIYFDFYSKWAEKTCSFKYSEDTPKVEHCLPDRSAKGEYDRRVLSDLPWKKSPQWIYFLKRVYDKVKPLHPALGTSYYLRASGWMKLPWSVEFKDEFNGNEFGYDWDGKGLDENSIKKA